ncbi:MAG: hypothetical protein R3B84_06740 [Zavarzinella sp.]
MSFKPDALKLQKEYSFKGILFGIARIDERLFLAASDFQVYEAAIAKDKLDLQPCYKHESYVTSLAVAKDVVISGSYDCKLTWYHTVTKKVIRSETAHDRWIRKVVVSPDQKTVVSVADDMIGKVWDVETGKLKFELISHEQKTPTGFGSMLYTACFSHDGKWIATADKVGKIFVWEANTGKRVQELHSPGMYTWEPVARLHSIGGIRSIAFDPSNQRIAVGGIGKIGNIDHLEGKARLEMFEWNTAKSLGVYESGAHKGLNNVVRFSEDGKWLLAAGGAGNGHMIFLDAATLKPIREEKSSFHVHEMLMDEAKSHLITVGHQKLATYQA